MSAHHINKTEKSLVIQQENIKNSLTANYRYFIPSDGKPELSFYFNSNIDSYMDMSRNDLIELRDFINEFLETPEIR